MARPPRSQFPAARAWRPSLALASAVSTALVVAFGAPAHAQEVRLRWVLPAGDLYQGQTFALGLEVTATAPDEGGFVQLFPQPLGLPIQLEALGALEAMEQLELFPLKGPSPPQGRGGAPAPAEGLDQGIQNNGRARSVVLDGELVQALDLDPDAAVTQLRLTRLARARRAGPLRLPESVGRYAISSAFREDLVRGSVPVDREERTVRGASLTVDVLPLPERGQPVDFEGAVGAMTLEVSVEPNRARVGETLQLQVTVLGGSLNEGRAEPRLAPVEGLRLIGTRSARVQAAGRPGRTFRYDLEATSTAPTATPAVTLVTFDPSTNPPGYRTLSASPQPLAIRPGLPAAPTPGEPMGGPARPSAGSPAGSSAGSPAGSPAGSSTAAAVPSPLPPRSEGPEERQRETRLVWTPAVLIFIFVLAAVSTRRRRRSGGRDPQ